MRITILANNDLASNIAVNQLLKELPEHSYHIILSTRVGGKKKPSPSLTMLAFFEQTLFNQIVAPLADTVANHPQHCLKSFTRLKEDGFAVDFCTNINDENGFRLLASHQPNLIVSVRFGQILQQPVIDVAEYGVLNLHSGKLPDYRGVMATFWAMYERKDTISCTLHYIDSAEIDAGQTVSVHSISLDYNKSYLANTLALYPGGVKMLVNAIQTLAAGRTLTRQHSSGEGGRYYTFPDEQVLKKFAADGLTLVNPDEIPAISKWYFATPYLDAL